MVLLSRGLASLLSPISSQGGQPQLVGVRRHLGPGVRPKVEVGTLGTTNSGRWSLEWFLWVKRGWSWLDFEEIWRMDILKFSQLQSLQSTRVGSFPRRRPWHLGLPSGNLSQFAMESMARLVCWFTYWKLWFSSSQTVYQRVSLSQTVTKTIEHGRLNPHDLPIKSYEIPFKSHRITITSASNPIKSH